MTEKGENITMNKKQPKMNTSINGRNSDEIIALKNSVKEIKKMVDKLEKRISSFESSIKSNEKTETGKQDLSKKSTKSNRKKAAFCRLFCCLFWFYHIL